MFPCVSSVLGIVRLACNTDVCLQFIGIVGYVELRITVTILPSPLAQYLAIACFLLFMLSYMHELREIECGMRDAEDVALQRTRMETYTSDVFEEETLL